MLSSAKNKDTQSIYLRKHVNEYRIFKQITIIISMCVCYVIKNVTNENFSLVEIFHNNLVLH